MVRFGSLVLMLLVAVSGCLRGSNGEAALDVARVEGEGLDEYVDSTEPYSSTMSR